MDAIPRQETDFAPAERADSRELQKQSSIFSEMQLAWLILDSLPTAIFILNQQRQIVYANQAVLALSGASALSEIVGQRPGESLSCVNAYEHQGGCGTSRFCRECGAVRSILSSLTGRQSVEECRLVRDLNGQQEPLDLRVWSTPLQVGGQSFVLFAVMDIAHEKRRQALEHIFLHDLLNVASIVQAASDQLPVADDDYRASLIEILNSASGRIVDEIQAQRDLLKAENHELEVQPAPIHARPFLAQLVEMFEHLPAKEGRQIAIDTAAEDFIFTSDATLLGRVLGNMLKNALEASQPGETVTVGCRPIGRDSLQFWVHNPAFMPEKVQVQIFMRSFTTKGKGRGLGTYSMRLLAENYLNGQVWFSTAPQSGTTFFIQIPRA